MTPNAITVTVPIRIRVDPPGVNTERGRAEVDAAVRAATARALAKAAKNVAVAPGHAWLTLVSVGWFGPEAGAVTGEARAQLERRIDGTIRALAKKAGIDAPPASAPPSAAPAFDVASMTERLASDNVSDRSIAFLEIWDLVADGDETAFMLALWAIRADGSPPTENVISALRELRKRDPGRFQRLFEQTMRRAVSGEVQRTESTVLVAGDAWDTGWTVGRALRAADAFPELGLVATHEKLVPGFARVKGLLDAFRDLRVELARYLGSADEETDQAHLYLVRSYPGAVQTLPVVFVGLSGQKVVQDLVKSLPADLTADIRWLTATIRSLREVDASLDLYERAFGAVAESQEEVQELRRVRALLVKLAADNELPTATLAATLETQGSEAVAGWRLAAADRRIQRLRATRTELAKYLRELKFVDPDPDGSLGTSAGDPRVPFRHRLEQTRLLFDELSAELDVGAERRLDLGPLLSLSNRFAELQTRVAILSHWTDTFTLEHAMNVSGLGDSDDRAEWKRTRDQVRAEALAAYDAPDYSMLEYQLKQWFFANQRLLHGLEHAARMRALKMLGIELVAIVAMIAVGNVLGAGLEAATAAEGLSVLEVRLYRAGITLAEAATGTTVSTIGSVGVLDQPFHPGETAKQFAETVAFMKVAEFLSTAIRTGAVEYFRGRPTAQAAAILWGNLAVSTGLPVAFARILHDDDTLEQDAMLVATGLAFGVVANQITRPKLLAELRRVAPARLHADLLKLHDEVAAFNRDWAAVLDEGPSSAPEFEKARARGVTLSSHAKTTLEELAAVPEETLASAGLTKKALLQQASLAGAWGRRIAGTHYVEGALVLPRGVLPPDVVSRGGGIYEYRAGAGAGADSQAKALARRLRSRGFYVTNEGGVISVSKTETDPPKIRLIPAGTSAEPPSGEAARARAVILGAAGPAADVVRPTLAQPAGEALVEAAKLEPVLVREAILADPPDEGQVLARLEGGLRADGMSKARVDRALEGVRTAASAQRVATASGPLHRLLVLAEGGPRGREVLATADGQALVEGMTLAPDETSYALMTTGALRPKAKAAAQAAWEAKGMSLDRSEAAVRGFDALLSAKNDSPTSPIRQLLPDDPGSGLQGWLDALVDKDLAAHRALLTAAEREPALLGRAVRSTDASTLAATTAELAERLQRSGMTTEDVMKVVARLREVNKIRLTSAVEYGALEEARVLLPDLPAAEAKQLLEWGYLPALEENPHVLAYAAQPDSAINLRALVGGDGALARFGEDPQVVFAVLERVLKRHAAAAPSDVAKLVDNLGTAPNELSDADLRSVVRDVDPEGAKALDKLSDADLATLRDDLRSENAVLALRAKLTDAELQRVYDLFPAKAWAPHLRESTASAFTDQVERSIAELLPDEAPPSTAGQPITSLSTGELWPTPVERAKAETRTFKELLATVDLSTMPPHVRTALEQKYRTSYVNKPVQRLQSEQEYLQFIWGKMSGQLAKDVRMPGPGMAIEARLAIDVGHMAERTQALLRTTVKNTVLYKVRFFDPVRKVWVEDQIIPDFMPTLAKDAAGNYLAPGVPDASQAVLIADSKYTWDASSKIGITDQIRSMIWLAKNNGKPFVFLVRSAADISILSSGIVEFARAIGADIYVVAAPPGVLQ